MHPGPYTSQAHTFTATYCSTQKILPLEAHTTTHSLLETTALSLHFSSPLSVGDPSHRRPRAPRTYTTGVGGDGCRGYTEARKARSRAMGGALARRATFFFTTPHSCLFVLLNSHILAYTMCLAEKVCGLVRSTWGTFQGEDKVGARDKILTTKVARRANIPPWEGFREGHLAPQRSSFRRAATQRGAKVGIGQAIGSL